MNKSSIAWTWSDVVPVTRKNHKDEETVELFYMFHVTPAYAMTSIKRVGLRPRQGEGPKEGPYRTPEAP